MVADTLSALVALSFLEGVAAVHSDAVIAEPDVTANNPTAINAVPLSTAEAAHTPAPERQPGLHELPDTTTVPSPMPAGSTTSPHTSDRLTFALRPNPVLAHEAHLGRVMKDWGLLSIILGGIGLGTGGVITFADFSYATGIPAGAGNHRMKARGPLILGAGAAILTGGILLLRGGNARRYAAAEAWNAEHPSQPVVY